MASKTIELTKAQERALIWAINTWNANYGECASEFDTELQAEIRGAYAALGRVYNQLDD
jgi:hypothetical protein